MNIAFVANGKKTQFFHEIGKRIVSNDSSIKLFYICFNKKQYQYYVQEEHISPTNILYLSYTASEPYSHLPIGEYKLNELVAYDRAMKYKFDRNLKYMVGIETLFFNFVKSNNLKYIFGEMTWAPEILMSRICKDKFKDSCVYLHPQSIRIPNGRFSFMDSEFQDGLYSKVEYFQEKSCLQEYSLPLKPTVPQRVAEVAEEVKRHLGIGYALKVVGSYFINRFKIQNKDKECYQTLSKKTGRLNRAKVEMNKLYYVYRLKTANWDEIKNKKFLFVTLHMQPEASVDVVGRYYDNQLTNIINIWRILPLDYYLVVKEHTNAIGNRGYSFFHTLQKYRNVIIANEQISSHELLNASRGVFTNSGTVALESALYEKEAFLFSDIFFDKIKHCHRLTLEDFKTCKSFFDLRETCLKRDENKMDIDKYSEYIIRSSFKGVIDPPDYSPLITDEDNINQIAESFLQFLSIK